MSEQVNWGVPVQRTRKVEKFSTPVITLSALAKKGAGRKISFNAAAQELLGLISGESLLAIGFDPQQNIFIKVATDGNFKITKTFSISDKRTYEYIAKIKELNTDNENYLTIDPVDGQSYFQVSGIVSEGVAEDIPQMNAPVQEDDMVEEEVLETVEATEEDEDDAEEKAWD